MELDMRKQISGSEKGFLIDNPNYGKPFPSTNQRERFFEYMAQEHGLTMLDSEMDEIQHILFPPSYPYDIDDTMLSKLSEYELIKLKAEISHRIRKIKNKKDIV